MQKLFVFYLKYEIVGKLKVDKTLQTMEAIEKKYEMMKDGKYKPKKLYGSTDGSHTHSIS